LRVPTTPAQRTGAEVLREGMLAALWERFMQDAGYGLSRTPSWRSSAQSAPSTNSGEPREAGPRFLGSRFPWFLSAAGTPTLTAVAQLAYLFFEALNPFGQPVEALVDPPPVSLFVLAAASPLASRGVRASLLMPAPSSGYASPGAQRRVAASSVAPVSPAAQSAPPVRCSSGSRRGYLPFGTSSLTGAAGLLSRTPSYVADGAHLSDTRTS
jgi:hypothetical protein